MAQKQYPVTPDGRYFVVKGRLWRCTNPQLEEDKRRQLVNQLMDARRAVKAAKKIACSESLKAARHRVNVAKIALGERGPVWWDDGSPDYNRKFARNTLYAAWFAGLDGE